MQRLQAQVEDIVRKDPDVDRRRVHHRRQPAQCDAQRGPPRDHAASRATSARVRRPRSSTRLKQAGRADSRHRSSISSRCRTSRSAPAPSRAQYQYTLIGSRRATRSSNWSAKLAEQLRSDPITARRRLRKRRRAACACWSKVDRETAGRLGVSMQTVNDTLNDAFGQRQISTIYGQANQYRVILEAAPEYQRDPAALSKIYVPAAGTWRQCRDRVTSLTPAARRPRSAPTPPTAAGAARAFARFERISAPLVDRAPGAVPLGHHQLQSGAGRCAQRRRRRDHAGRARRSACRRR